MKPVTVWRMRRGDDWQHNHIEDGHSSAAKPVGHTNWPNATWQKAHAWLSDALPARVCYFSPEEAGDPQ